MARVRRTRGTGRAATKTGRRPSLMMKKAGITRQSRPFKCGGKLKKK